jgi:probable phosphoglycerate mutase
VSWPVLNLWLKSTTISSEWDYGNTKVSAQPNHVERPDWQLFRDGPVATPDQVAERADRVVKRLRGLPGDILLFSSGHFLRVLAARWVGIETFGARSLMLSTASLSALGYEHSLDQPAITLWNETRHLRTQNGTHK